MNNEYSELQSVDFAMGEFIASAFEGLSKTTGPKEWKEFLSRATAAQIYRHDAATPGDFIKALQSSKKKISLPAVYYFRKPGYTNVNDRSKPIRGRYSWGEDLARVYNLHLLHIDLDYSIVFVAWDKPSLDKLCLGWYAYMTTHDTFAAKYRMGEDIMNVPCTVLDHTNLTITDSSEPAENGRLFAASTNYTVHTMVMFGAEIAPPPDIMRIQYGIERTERQRVIAGYGDGVTVDFSWSALHKFGKEIVIIGSKICIGGEIVAIWDDVAARFHAVGDDYGVVGTMQSDAGRIEITITPPPSAGSQIEFCMDTDVQLVAESCPSCHDMR